MYSIVIVTATFNPHIPTFYRMLESVKCQKYNGTITHLVLDGGSTNGAVALAKKYGCQVKIFTNDKDEGLSRYHRCLRDIQGEISIILESDNILPSKNWMAQIIEPFEDPDIFASYPAYNTSTKDMDILTRYTALIGSPDPTLYYLGKSDKIPVFQKNYNKGELLKETQNYYKIRFTKNTLPTVGDNGFALRSNIFRGLIEKNRVFFHTDVFSKIIAKGHNTYGVTKNAIIHMSKPGILDQVARRVEVKEHFTDGMKEKRTYLVYDSHSRKDRRNLLLFILYSLTVIQPLIFSIRGFMCIPEPAWFLHPVMCILMVFGYGFSEIKHFTRNIVCQKN